MKTSDCYYLGYVTKTFGYKGEVSLFFDVDDPLVYSKMESVFILLGEKLVPFFVETLAFRPNSREAYVRFQGVDTEAKAGQLCGKELYMPLAFLPKLTGNSFYYHEIEGFEAIDTLMGPIGVVEQVIDLPGNPLFQVKRGYQEILIPLREEFIDHVDREHRKIILTAPEGLIDIYLGS